MKKYFAAAGAVALAVSLGACSDDNDGDSANTTAVETSEATESTFPSDAAEQMEADIVDTAESAGDFMTLLTAVKAAGLEDTLRGDGPFTVFAPTDEAFSALPTNSLDDLLADPTGTLSDILKYHVVEGKVMADDVAGMDGETVTTLLGEGLTVEVDGDTVYLVDGTGNRVSVTVTDVEASNGVIHVIDGVLMPSGDGMSEGASQ